ncbi:MAG: isoprenylcysteine carboxylmethyltransferase family protein [Chlorobi bacterium]|nr:isoprenylcysteine carboxylmethyltransferase family protein [Chlorobiota bacterium]
MDNLKPKILTFVQYVSLIWLLAFNKWFSDNLFLLAFQVVGIIIGFWAIYEMSKSRLNITPTPLSGASLVRSGPYKLVRHPMYLSLILVFGPMLFYNFNLWGGIVFLVFFVNLILKMLYEEKLLMVFFDAYKTYSEKSWRLIPYVY